ncbi:MAG: methyl-accepting chemotaxis protein, partial [Proteobacteria bacterium]|nr:methyl-accepting chemotaxis protein [Pseudomonadota bacterium]
MKLRFHQLSVAQKLALICLLFLMPDGVMLYFVITGFHGHIRFAEWEQKGNEYQRPLMELLYRLPQHAELAGRVRRGEAQAGGALGRKQAEIDAAFDSLAQVEARLGAALQFTDEGLAKRKREHLRVATVRREWDNLKVGLAQVTPEHAAAQHRHLVADMRAMITHVGDLSNLILDPDLDSYYLMDVTLLALPQMQQRLGEVVEYGAAALERPGMSMTHRQQLAIFADLLREVDADHIAASIRTSVTEDANFYGESATLQARLPSAYTQWFAAADEFIKLTARIAQADAAG